MKTKLLLFSVMTTLLVTTSRAQDRTSVNAMNSEISDNLDLRAIASIFGDSRDLDDFERRLNDPKAQISNLDLNNDNQVDYLRVVESVESNTHLIVVQAVLDRDVYQDVATIDVERDRNNKVQVQVIGDVYMYGENYIYEPVYYTTPVIYASFWRPSYRAYTSRWNWGYYPSYYYTWNPFPVFRYRNNISICLNRYNSYNYVNYRTSSRAVVLYNSRRSNGYERQYPNYAFSRRNVTVSNRYELDQRRTSSRAENTYGRRTTNDVNRYSTNGARQNRTVQSSTSGRYDSQGRARTANADNSNRIATGTENNRYSSRTNSETAPITGRTDRSYSQNRTSTTTERGTQRSASPNTTAPSRSNSGYGSPSRRESTPRDYSQNRSSSAPQAAPQRQESSSRGNSGRGSETRGNSNQRGSSERSENRRS